MSLSCQAGRGTWAAMVLFILVSCGGASRASRSPIDLPARSSREQVRAALSDHQFCFYVWTESLRKEEYADCNLPTTNGGGNHPMVGYGQPTVGVRYHEDGSMDRLQRLENYRTDTEARDRFDELSSAREKKSGPPVPDPGAVYGTPPPDTRAWKVWLAPGGQALMSIMIVEEGHRQVVVEEIISARAPQVH